ncbi:MAG: GNAT family N-acetyltransferase [Bacillota bacterium]
MGFEPLQTDRLILRPLELADAEEVRRLAGAPEVASTTLSIPHPYPEGAAEQFIAGTREEMEAGRSYALAMVRREDGALLGVISLTGIHPVHRRAELGYWIGVPYWGQGYTTEAARAMIDFAFGELGLNSVFARHLTRNPASGRVMAKVGMRCEGRLRQHVCKNGQFEDLAVYSILRTEWEAASRPAPLSGIQLQPIGLVENGVIEPVDEGWGEVLSTIRLQPHLNGIVDGLEQFSHALVICYLHETPAVDEVKRRPRGRADMPEVGLLAQRARHRPNPIAVTAVEVLSTGPDRLVVRGLDAIHGTPVLDIKPYFPAFDRRDDARVPEWVNRLMEGYF